MDMSASRDYEYRQWLSEYVAVNDKSGVPYTREVYFKMFFDKDIDTRRIYEQDVHIRKELHRKDAMADTDGEQDI